jgi:hypothetical protein
MIHYHGGPITPDTCAIKAWKGRHAFISFAAPHQVGLSAKICQSFALDNGAFSAWKVGQEMRWIDYYEWVKKWACHPGFDFAVIPDVIDGTEEENDALLAQWPLKPHQGAPVWHINESFFRLKKLASRWPRVCIGSSGEFDVTKQDAFLQRAHEAIQHICNDDGQPKCKLHGLRMLNPEIFTQLPLASADSTNVARNIGIDSAWRGTYSPQSKETRTSIMVERIEHFNSADRLGDRPHQFTLWSAL